MVGRGLDGSPQEKKEFSLKLAHKNGQMFKNRKIAEQKHLAKFVSPNEFCNENEGVVNHEVHRAPFLQTPTPLAKGVLRKECGKVCPPPSAQ